MEEGLVSVIIPTYNTGKLLGDCLDSILAQTYRDLEIVITDDHSSDPLTISILKAFEKKDKRVRICWLPENGGAGKARNNSIRQARGRYIAFCDSDDVWFPDKLERQIRFMQQGGHTLVCSSYIMCDEEGGLMGIVKCPEKITYGMLKRDNKIGCLTAVYDSKPCGKFYLPTIRKRQDWAMFLNIVRQCGPAYAIKEPLARYSVRQKSLSRNKFSLVKYNISVYNKILGFSRLGSLLYFLFLFLPTHFAKVLKVMIDSRIYIKEKRKENKQIK